MMSGDQLNCPIKQPISHSLKVRWYISDGAHQGETTLFLLIGSSRSSPLGSHVSGIIRETHLDLILLHFCSFDSVPEPGEGGGGGGGGGLIERESWLKTPENDWR